MSLISQINGSFLSKLTTGGKEESKDSESSLSGFSEGSSFEAAVVDIRPGLSRGAKAFVDSLDRMNSAIVEVSESRDVLENIKSSVDRMLIIAEKASERGVSDEDRADLSLDFEAEILKLRELVKNADTGDVDFLSMDDLETILGLASIDLEGTSDLAQTFSSLGGRDGELGTERVTLADTTVVDPLSLSVKSEDEALNAVEAFTALKKQVDRDFSGIEEIYEDLRGAALFARAGAVAFDNAIEYASNLKDPSQVAQLIVESIRNLSAGASLVEHSSLDTKLARDLLAE